MTVGSSSNLRLATWNVNRNRSAQPWWDYLRDDVGVQAALVQEAAPPSEFSRACAFRQFGKPRKDGAGLHFVSFFPMQITEVTSLALGAVLSIYLPDRQLRIINVHATRDEAAGLTRDYLTARRCIDAILGTLDSRATIIAGDFNVSVHLRDGHLAHGEFRKLALAGFRDVLCDDRCLRHEGVCASMHPATRQVSGTNCRIDYVFANAEAHARVEDCHTLEPTVPRLSDHVPIVFEMR
jgi:exonuclease III